MIGVEFPEGAMIGIFFFGSGAQQASYPTSNGGSFPGGLSGQGVKLTTYPHLLLMVRMGGAIYFHSPDTSYTSRCLLCT